MTLAVGIDLGASNLRLGIVNQEGTLLNHIQEPVDWTQSPDQLIERIATLSEQFPDFADVSGVGLAIAATVKPDGTIDTNSANISLPADYKLPSALSTRLNLPVCIDNDANLALLGEATFGAAKGKSEVLLLTLGTGIGGALLLNGRLRRGKRGITGEVGLIQMRHPDGSGFAAVESFAAPGALAKRLGHPGAHLTDLMRLMNGRVTPLLNELYDHVALLIINAHLLIEFDLILLSGGFAENGESLRIGVEKAVQRLAPVGLFENLQIAFGSLPSSTAGVIGAAAFWFSQTETIQHPTQ